MKKNNFSYLANAENQYINALYEEYLKNPHLVEESWQKFFEGLEFGLHQAGSSTQTSDTLQDNKLSKELRVLQLIQAYRSRGHLASQTNPIRPRKDRKPKLDLSDFGLSQEDLNEEFLVGQEINLGKATLKNILEHLNKLYCGPIGLEFMYINNSEIRQWIKDRYESSFLEFQVSPNDKKRILATLKKASAFEGFLHSKYIGQKRFSLEGGEATLAALEGIIDLAPGIGVEEIVISMAHRGRLNVLANIMGKSYEYIFSEFEGQIVETPQGDGDVKYHLGFSSWVKSSHGKEIFLKLMPNPSHLEAVTPVAQGYTRAKAVNLYKGDFLKILPIQIHGDAALAGQGVVYECVQMSQLPGYQTGGTIHFVINNQIGFTTDFRDGRSADYSTSVARVVESPVIHVNGDNVEAVIFAIRFAAEFRQKFGRDIFIDMVCYRKYGHNEGDEPKFTQPKLYNLIGQHPYPKEIYEKSLIKEGVITPEEAQKIETDFKKHLQDCLNKVKTNPVPYQTQGPDNEWKPFRKSKPEDFVSSPETAVSREILEKILRPLTTLPPSLKPISKAAKILEGRANSFKLNQVDWALAELLAYGTLLLEGHHIRISGQDVLRGTFSHRHAYVFDEETNEGYCPLQNLDPNQGSFQIFNSILSEFGVLGFEYGYSLGRPNDLIIWEAQFGDFVNGAQTIIDQFISSAESKWQTSSGITLFLPHGYEGQGPEHSSTRPERFLQLCAEFNMLLAYCTTPASFFHLLRRQLKYPFRKPLVVLTPKSLLRHPACVSTVEEFTNLNFEEIIDDSHADPKKVRRVLLCSGKIYYDLLEKKNTDKREDIALVRFEQLHPIPYDKLNKILGRYSKAEFVWVQEEPKNMGFWNYILRKLDIPNLKLVSRKSSASTATGYLSLHLQEQKRIIEMAFGETINRP